MMGMVASLSKMDEKQAIANELVQQKEDQEARLLRGESSKQKVDNVDVSVTSPSARCVDSDQKNETPEQDKDAASCTQDLPSPPKKELKLQIEKISETEGTSTGSSSEQPSNLNDDLAATEVDEKKDDDDDDGVDNNRDEDDDEAGEDNDEEDDDDEDFRLSEEATEMTEEEEKSCMLNIIMSELLRKFREENERGPTSREVLEIRASIAEQLEMEVSMPEFDDDEHDDNDGDKKPAAEGTTTNGKKRALKRSDKGGPPRKRVRFDKRYLEESGNLDLKMPAVNKSGEVAETPINKDQKAEPTSEGSSDRVQEEASAEEVATLSNASTDQNPSVEQDVK